MGYITAVLLNIKYTLSLHLQDLQALVYFRP